MKKILFEPWHLGDALIAASVLKLSPDRFILACASRYHVLIRSFFPVASAVTLMPLDLSYTSDHAHRFQIGELAAQSLDRHEILSIRGDPRDYWSARKLFPKADISMTGWSGFMARRIKPLNWPFALGLLPVKNRYRLWAQIAGIDFKGVEAAYDAPTYEPASHRKVAIYVGARYFSRQYPHVSQLATLLRAQGVEVDFFANQKAEADNLQLKAQLIDETSVAPTLRKYGTLITNDTAYLHVGPFLGLKTFVVSRISNIAEWLPPRASPIVAKDSPRGYAAHPGYNFHAPVGGWPTADEVVEHVMRHI